MSKISVLAWVVLLAGCVKTRDSISRPAGESELTLVSLAAEAVRASDEEALGEIAFVQAQSGDGQGSELTLLAIRNWHHRYQTACRIIRESPRLRPEVARRLLALARKTLEDPDEPASDDTRNRELYGSLALGYAQWEDDRGALWALSKMEPRLQHWIEAARGVCVRQIQGDRKEAALDLARSTEEPQAHELYAAIAIELAERGKAREGLELADRCGESTAWVRLQCLLRLPNPTSPEDEPFAPFCEAAEVLEQLDKEAQPRALLELSFALLREGKRDESWRALEVAKDRARFDDPLSLVPISRARVDFKFSAGDLEGAVEECATGFLGDGDRHEVLRELGQRLIAQGKLDEAASLIPHIGDHGSAVRLGDLGAALWRKGEKEAGMILIRRAVDRYARFLKNREVPFDTVLADGRGSVEDDFVELLGNLGMMDPRELMAGLPRWQEYLEGSHVQTVLRTVGRYHPEGVDLPEWPPDRRLYLQLGMIEGRLGMEPR